MTQAQRLAALFDRASSTYDQVGVELFGPVAEALVGDLDVRPGERVLDVGCGRGAVLLRAARIVGESGRAVGLDLSPAMVEATRQEADAARLRVEVHLTDAGSEDLPAGQFDVITSSLVLFFLPEPVGALRRWRTLLAPGGRVGVTTFGDTDSAWEAVDRVVMSHAPPAMRDPRAFDPQGPFRSDAGVEGLLTEAGFARARSEHHVVPVRFADEDQWYRWSWSVGQRAVWESLAPGDRTSVRSRAVEAMQHTRDAQGRIGFDQDVRVTLGDA